MALSIGDNERAAQMELMARQFAERARAGDDVVFLAAAPGEAALVTSNHPRMYETAIASNHFLAEAYGSDDARRDLAPCRICAIPEERDGLCSGHREEWIQWAANHPWAQNERRYEWWIESRIALVTGITPEPSE